MRLRVAGAALIALLAVVSFGCSVPTPSADITSGSGPSQELDKNLGALDFRLPREISDLEWVQAVDWDTQNLYLRFRTTEDGLSGLHHDCGLQDEELESAPPGSWDALPSSSDWAEDFPHKEIDWAPTSWANTVAANQFSLACGAATFMLIERGVQPQVFMYFLFF